MLKKTKDTPCEGLVLTADIIPSFTACIDMHFDPYENLTHFLVKPDSNNGEHAELTPHASMQSEIMEAFGAGSAQTIFIDPDEVDGRAPYNVVQLDSIGNPDLVFEWTDRIAAFLAASRGTEGHLLQYDKNTDLCYLNPGTSGDGQSIKGLTSSALARAQAMIAMEEASYTLPETLTDHILPGLTDMAGLGNPWVFKDKGDFIKAEIPWLDKNWHFEISSQGYEKARDGSGYSAPVVKVSQDNKCIFDGPADGKFLKEQILEKLFQSNMVDREETLSEIDKMKHVGPDSEGYFMAEDKFISKYIPAYDGPRNASDISAPAP